MEISWLEDFKNFSKRLKLSPAAPAGMPRWLEEFMIERLARIRSVDYLVANFVIEEIRL